MPHPSKSRNVGFAATHRGSALVVVVILLLLATIMTLFAVRVGLFDQRSSGNDVRAKSVQSIADSGLTQGAEFILANTATLLDSDTGWTKCAQTDTSFPCGAVVAARRGTMWAYTGGVGRGAPYDGFELRFLNVGEPLTTATNGFPVVSGIGAVKCRLAPAALGEPAACTDTPDPAGNFFAVTLVSVAAMGGEGARATAVKTFATHSSFSLGGGQPPVMASGTIELRGNARIVTNPNAAGPGVPVSVWTRTHLDPGGTPDTCYQDEFYRTSTPTWFPADAPAADQILRCDDCTCGSTGVLTTGQGNSCTGGMDILGAPADCGPNQAVRPEEFPCDLFQHIFGVQARTDENNDHFCEKVVMVPDPAYPAKSSTPQIAQDEAYLYEKADWIIKGNAVTGFDQRFVGDARVITCDQVEGKNGLIWVRNVQCGDGKTIGSPTAPVLYVHDGNGNNSPSFQGMTLFGLLFVRSVGHANLDPATGGTAKFKFNGGTEIYGSVVVQGMIDKAAGQSAVIYNEKVLSKLIAAMRKPSVYALPGAWTDNVQY